LALAADSLYIYAGTRSGLLRSSDDGESWSVLIDKKDINSIITDGDILIIATNDEIMFSHDKGTVWENPIKRMRWLHLLNKCGNYFFAGAQDKIFHSADYGLTWDTIKVKKKFYVIYQHS